MDGVLILHKPSGPTSHDVVGLVRRLSGTKRVGHGGTLDPFASGVLPVFLGLATRLVEYHMGDGKAYRATACFGASSATDDRDGELAPGAGPAPTRDVVVAALAGFRGQIEQRPPAYSALKVAGRRAYELARQGIATELAPRTVTIRRIELMDWDDSDPARPTAVLDVECGAGTYIRAIARDLGERLGCGGYLGALTRTSSGPFRLEAAHDLDELRAAALDGPEGLARLLLPIDAGLDAMASTQLTDAEVAAVSRGQQIKPVRRPTVAADRPLRLLDERGALVGVGSVKAGRIVPEKIFVAPPISAAAEVAAEVAAATGAATGGNARAADIAVAPKAPQPPENREPRLRVATLTDPAVVVGGVDALPSELGRLYVAVGVFDGLHRGHLYLLRELRRAAERAGAKAAVITFDAHPEEVVLGLAPPLLCDPDERLVRLAAAGAEVTVVQHFDHALRMTSYEEFVARIRSRVELAGFVMTPDAAFGHDREGTPTTLAALGLREGFVVSVVPSLLVDGEQVRSSEIRRRVADGDLGGARHLLGRPLSVMGRLAAAEGPGAASAPRRLEFDLPVTLPPAGRYSVLVGPPWGHSLPPEPARRPTLATVEEGTVLLEPARGVPASAARIRVVFMDREPGT
ncbi:MAG TPA: tRNA pseudouridine(55) synthase TruB [Candidatus Limnocylindrales bacterium]